MSNSVNLFELIGVASIS